MKFTILISLILITTASVAQNGGTISNAEKKQLESKFKALSNFYIDDTGLVVYRDQPTQPSQNTSSPSMLSNGKVVSNRSESSSVVEREPLTTNSVVSAKEDNERQVVQKYGRDNSFGKVPIVVSKQPISTTSPEIIVVQDKSKSTQALNSNAINIDKQSANDDRINEVTIKTVKAKPQGSIFDRRRKSEYKNMEEAALAVEALLEDLKKEQVILKGSGSMSSRLAKGVTKDLRRRETVISDPYQSVSTIEIIGNAFDDDESVVTEYGNEPSYFINGVQVEKIQVNKLTKDDIINREIRVKNTVTNNPNGEIWYTVRADAVY